MKLPNTIQAYLSLLYCVSQMLWFYKDSPPAKWLWFSLLWYLPYCGGLEQNLQYLWGMPVVCSQNNYLLDVYSVLGTGGSDPYLIQWKPWAVHIHKFFLPAVYKVNTLQKLLFSSLKIPYTLWGGNPFLNVLLLHWLILIQSLVKTDPFSWQSSRLAR